MNQLGARGSVETTRRWGPYPYYKDSGVEWLGEIPEHWSIMPIKRIFYILNGSTPKSSEPSYWSGSISWATPDDLGSLETDTLKITKRMITQEGYESCGTQLAPTGSLVLSTRAPIGHLAIAGVPLCTNQGCRCLVFRGKTQNRFYYHQLLAAKQELESWGQGSTFKELSRDKLVSVSLVSPTLDEQQAITAFLDRETSRIDTLIAKKQRQIELLQEKRTALISHAVTKGLNPEAKMKDSGIEWLGEIPEHWTLLSIKRLTLVKRGASPRPIDDPKYFEDEGEYAWVRIADVTASNRYLEKTTQRLSELGKSLSIPLEPGDLFLSIAGTVGKPIITKIKCCIHDGFVYFPQYFENKEFLYYIFASGQPYKGLGKWGTQLNLNTDTVGGIHIGLPPRDEQDKIVTFLDFETQQVDVMIKKVNSSISLLQEYRTALISAAVTGKIDVRKEVACTHMNLLCCPLMG